MYNVSRQAFHHLTLNSRPAKYTTFYTA